MYTRGFSLIEALIVIGIAAILGTIAYGAMARFGEQSLVDGEARLVHSVLSDARSRTLASRDDERYGVHFVASPPAVVLFRGQYYDVRSTTNATTSLSTKVSLATDFTAGTSTIAFQKITGEAAPSGTTTLTLLSGKTSRQISIVIYPTGSIEVVD